MVVEQLQHKLAASPSVDPKIYYRWLIDYQAKQVMDEYEASPLPASKACDLIKSIDFEDPISVSELHWKINTPPGFDKLPLGRYTAETVTNFCFLQLCNTLLPQDFKYDETRADTSLTQAKYKPDELRLPRFFYEIGQLCISTAPTLEKIPFETTEFVVVVAPGRQVFAVWNPLGVDPEHPGSDEVDRTAFQTRPTSGLFPGFTAPCTAFALADDINDLCNADQSSRFLPIKQSTMITLAPKTTIEFGGVDEEGWLVLERQFPIFDGTKIYSKQS